MALEDAWVLAVQWGQPDAMARYQRRRRLRVMTLWGMSRWIGTMIQCEQPWLCKLRDLQMRLTPNVVATVMMRALLHDKPEDLPTV
jgi:2-polyprenyl-6-methoxyphenol hydroxylase-like FAD-dependent oxidoreductase